VWYYLPRLNILSGLGHQIRVSWKATQLEEGILHHPNDTWLKVNGAQLRLYSTQHFSVKKKHLAWGPTLFAGGGESAKDADANCAKKKKVHDIL